MEEQVLWPVLIVGLLIGTLGWMIYWAGINVIGAFVGAGAGVAMAGLVITSFSLARFGPFISMAGLILGAVGGVYLMRAINYYAFFIIGVMLGAPIGSAFPGLSIFENQDWAHSNTTIAISTAVGALAGGMLVLVLRRYVIAMVAAVAGAMLVAISVPEQHREVVGLLAFIASAIIQFMLIRAFLPEERMNLMAVERKPKSS